MENEIRWAVGMPSSRHALIGALTLLLLLAAVESPSSTFSRRLAGDAQVSGVGAVAKHALESIPIAFEPNVGQSPSKAGFLAHLAGGTAYLSPRHFVLARADGESVRVRFPGGAVDAEPVGTNKLPGVSNYFIGDDPANWHTDIPTYGAVMYENVYPGIDLVYHGATGRLEYDFVVHPGVDPKEIAISVDDARLAVAARGSLVARIGGAKFVQDPPQTYQTIDGMRRPVDSRFVVTGPQRARIWIGRYDATRPLVIDPVLAWSTFQGGAAADSANGVAVDSSGVYVVGSTQSTNFPIKAPLQPSNAGGTDAFVAKLSGSGNQLVYSTYLGGTAADAANGVAVDSTGAAYIGGGTESSDFPIKSAFQPAKRGGPDGFVTKLDPTGSLVYSTYLGGSGIESGQSVATSGGAAYAIGTTDSSDFPTKSPVHTKRLGTDVFVTKLASSGSALEYSTYLGGGSRDEGYGVAVDPSGAAYLVGLTGSDDFPTKQPFQSSAQNGDAFVTKLDAGGGLVYSTHLGGAGFDFALGVTVDSAGSAFVAGATESANFPLAMPFQQTIGGSRDAFIAKFHPSGSALAFSSYLGGTGFDTGYDVAVDSSNAAHVVGMTQSANFPTKEALQASNRGGSGDGFLTKLDAGGSTLSYSTYLGGGSFDSAKGGVAIDPSGAVYVVGETYSGDYPTKQPLQSTNGGGQDGFISKVEASPSPSPSPSRSPTPSPSPSRSPPTPSPSPSPSVVSEPHECDGADAIVGTEGHDVLMGSPGDDVICGLGGNDTLLGNGGDDLLYGHAGNDTMSGNKGHDSIEGADGNDSMGGGPGNDYLEGGSGNDSLLGHEGDDYLDGRAGNDTLNASYGADTLLGRQGNDYITGASGPDYCNGGAGTNHLSSCTVATGSTYFLAGEF